MKPKVTREMLDAMAEIYGIERPYEVCAHTTMGGYMEFLKIEKCTCEDVARIAADRYAETWRKRKSENVKSICVRKGAQIVYEITL